MALIIGYGFPQRLALEQLETWPDTSPDGSAFVLPEEASAGDRVLWYIGGSLRKYVGIGRTNGEWFKGRSGEWKGVWGIGTSKPRRLAPFVAAGDVARACGLPVPKGPAVVERRLERPVLDFVQGRPVDETARALEGAATESKSRRRNPTLRRKALAKANGVCAVCGTDFKSYANGLGQRCLVVHHTRQIRDYDDIEETKLSDLAVVCANCHMLIHTDSEQALSVSQVAALIRKARPI